MKMIAGEFASASSNAFLKFVSDSPDSLLMISGPLMVKQYAPVSAATARAIMVLPHPGGPYLMPDQMDIKTKHHSHQSRRLAVSFVKLSVRSSQRDTRTD